MISRERRVDGPAAVIAEQRLGPTRRGALSLRGGGGLAGRESLAMDQDNALVFADGAGRPGDRWFEQLGNHIADILHEAGFYCQGGVMAKKPQWRGSLATCGGGSTTVCRSSAQDRCRSISSRQRPRTAMAACAPRLAGRVDAAANEVASPSPAEAAGSIESGLGLFDAQDQWGRIDLKKRAVRS